jgi:UPF0716 protein FxsA
MWLFFIFVAVPLIEIALFIQVGGAIGLWSTLAIVVLTAILGTTLVRSQGARAMMQLRQSFDELRDPSEPLANGAMILFSGALLLTPGFFTDAVGLLLLMPGVRKAIYQHLRARVEVQSFQYGGQPPPQDGDTIEADYEEVTPPPSRPRDRPSGWTKH